MFYASVLTGCYTQVCQEIREPPINLSSGRKYDSVVNNYDDPSIFVVFSSSYAYPHYLITFKDDHTRI